jgi:hypothetical protein
MDSFIHTAIRVTYNIIMCVMIKAAKQYNSRVVRRKFRSIRNLNHDCKRPPVHSYLVYILPIFRQDAKRRYCTLLMTNRRIAARMILVIDHGWPQTTNDFNHVIVIFLHSSTVVVVTRPKACWQLHLHQVLEIQARLQLLPLTASNHRGFVYPIR